MRTLFLDLASHEGYLACVTTEGIVADCTVDHRVRDHELLPLIDQLIASAGWTIAPQGDDRHLEGVACVTGPGGFTSLRVGVTCANTLADQLDIPIAGVHLSDLYRARCDEQDVLWLHSTKRIELFVRGCGMYAAHWPEAIQASLDSLLADLPVAASFCGELLPEHREGVERRGLIAASLQPIADIVPALIRQASYSKSPLQPWYGREG